MRIPIFQRAAETPWAITEDYLHTILDVAQRNAENPEAVAARLGRQLENTYDVEYRDGVAILTIEGPLFRYANLMTEVSGATSYERVAKDFTAAVEDAQVSAILLNIDSPGGEANGINELSDMIYAARGTKPITAYVGGKGASGGYWIASAADRIVVDETSLLGSIGVRTAMLDDSQAMQDAGFREYVIVSSQSPYKGVDPASEEDRGRVQTIVDDLASVFVSKVARNRGVSEETVLAEFGQGDQLVGQKAIDAGLADALGSFEGVISEIGNPDRQPMFNSGPAAAGHATKEGAMYLTSKAPAAGEDQRQNEVTAENVATHCPEVAEALRAEGEQRASGFDPKESVTAERERIAGILNCDEAEGRPALAKQLALTESMSFENAQRILAASAKEGGNGSPFLNSMEGEDIGVGPDTTDPDGDPSAMGRSIAESARTGGLIR